MTTSAVAVVYGRGGHVEAVVSTAAAFRPDGFRVGQSLTDVESRLGSSRIAATGRGLLVATGGLVFVIKSGGVQALALADPTLLPHLGTLAAEIHRSGLL